MTKTVAPPDLSSRRLGFFGRRGAKFFPEKNQVLIESLTPGREAVFIKSSE